MSVVEAGIAVVAPEAATACPLCAAQVARPAPRPADRYETLLPWAAAMTAAIVLASAGFGSDQSFGAGSVAGLVAGAALAAVTLRRAVGAERSAHARAVADLTEESETRVSMVIRQFEWSINDLAKLKREHDRAHVTADLLVVQARGRERHIKKLERELADARERVERLAAFAQARLQDRAAPKETTDTNVPFRWGTHAEGEVSRLELECDVRYRAAQIRIIDRLGITKMKSATAVHTGDGSLCFALAQPPAELVADLNEGREPTYRLQAMCDGEWLPIRLLDSGRRTRVMTDKQGRAYRVNDVVVAERRSAAFNPFDPTSDGTFFSL